MKQKFAQNFTLLCLLLTACADTPPEVFENRNAPEKLLQSSSELVTIDLSGKDYADRLADALAQEPTRAILHCPPDSSACKKTAQMLNKNKVASENTGSGGDVVLVYTHITARLCDNRYTDNSQNQLNLNYGALGCSVSDNLVQMVTDKRQFTDPGLLDHFDGEKAAAVYDNYANPPAPASGGAASSGGSAVNSLIPTSSSGGQ